MVWYPLKRPVTEQHDTAVVRQRPGYMQLSQVDGAVQGEISAEAFL